MKYKNFIEDIDLDIIMNLKDFVPQEVYDIHSHSYNSAHFAPGAVGFLKDIGTQGCIEHQQALVKYMPVKTIHGLYFGMPHSTADRAAINEWITEEVKQNGTTLSKLLKLVAPQDDQIQTANELRKGLFCGLKVYHIYSDRPDTMNASLTEYAPEWMWEILHETKGVMMLHIVREGAIADRDNQLEIRRLCRTYPNVKLILAHIARSFNYRNARKGLHILADLDNVVVDTSAVCETESFRAAWDALGPRRILWGSDFPVSQMRGRCVSVGSHFYWLHPEGIGTEGKPGIEPQMTLVGIESLLCLREMSTDAGLNDSDINDIFMDNALRILQPHLPATAVLPEINGSELWQHARTVISGGTGLLSKRAEMFDEQEWPAFFSRSSGCEVWDMNDRRYLDFAGGIGAVLLGYADPDVNAAVKRKLSLGSYSSLVNPDEVKLAETLMHLHPWAGKVKYARSGGEAMAMAVRIARAITGKSGIAFCGYHGWHDWYLAANLGENSALDGHLLPGLAPHGVPRELQGTAVPFFYNDLDSFESALEKLGNNFAAVVMEPMRSQTPKDDFLQKVADRCRAMGGILVIDEITSGLRYGFPGALSGIGVEPDVVVYAKAMSNGIPFATVIGKESVMSTAESSFISSSYWTDGLGTAAAIAVLEKVQRLNVFEVVWKRGVDFQNRLKELAAKYRLCGLEIGGMPSSPSLDFKLGEHSSVAKKYYIRKMKERGFLVSTIFYLMYAHTEEHITMLTRALDKTLLEMEQEIGIIKSTEITSDGDNPFGFARLT